MQEGLALVYIAGVEPTAEEAKRLAEIRGEYSRVSVRNASRFKHEERVREKADPITGLKSTGVEVLRSDVEPCIAVITDNKTVKEAYEKSASYSPNLIELITKVAAAKKTRAKRKPKTSTD